LYVNNFFSGNSPCFQDGLSGAHYTQLNEYVWSISKNLIVYTPRIARKATPPITRPQSIRGQDRLTDKYGSIYTYAMFRICSLIFLLLFAALHMCVVHAESAVPSTPFHEINTTLFPSEKKLLGIDKIRVEPGGSDGLEFDLARSAQVSRVTVEGSVRSFTLRDGRLSIPIQPGEKSKVITVTIEYSAVFNDSVPDMPLNTDNPGYGVTGMISEKGCFLLEGAGWYPRIPGSRPTYRLTVEAPEGILAVSAGKNLGHDTRGGKTYSAWEVDFPLDGLSLSAGPYSLRQRMVNGIQISTYFLSQTQNLSESYLDAAARYLVFYENLIGPYPFSKFAVVENFFPTGYGFPSYTLLGSAVLRLPFILETSFGHEIAHSWWGNGVLVDYRQGNWCEGLTTYLSDYLYKENSSAEEAREYRLQILRNFATLVHHENDFPLARFQARYDPASQAIGYGKGAMVFHMIRRKVGDKAFWEALREIYKEHRFQETSWQDFQKAFERHGQCSLQNFFDQWVQREGAPLLSLDSVAMEPLGGLFKVRAFILQDEPVYDLDLDVVLESESLRGHKKVKLSGPATLLEVPSFGRPLRLMVDPEFHVFRALYPSEIPPTVNSIKSSDSLTIVLSEAWQAKGATLGKTLALSLGVKNYRIVHEDDFKVEDEKSLDLLYVGFPEKGRIPMNPSPGLVLEVDKFILQDRTFEAPSAVFFGVFQRPESRDRFVALFLPLSTGDFENVARKITHYGKYSYLAFTEGKNEMKGTWPITDSPLIYSWKME
jgi:hypothetical protein